MSKDSVKNFYEFLKQDASAVEELKKAAEKVDTAEKATEAIIAFAAEKVLILTKKTLPPLKRKARRNFLWKSWKRSMPVPGDFVYCSGSAGVTPKEAAGIGAE